MNDKRLPDYRHRRAKYIARHWSTMSSALEFEDPAVVKYARFLHNQSQLSIDEQRRHSRMHEVLSGYHTLASQEAVGNKVLSSNPQQAMLQVSGAARDRAMIKAFVIGGLPRQELSELMDIDVQVLALFEYLAWDVRDRLHSRGWLHNYIFVQPVISQTAASDYERQYFQYVYKHGAEGLKQFLFLNQDMDAENYVDDVRKNTRIELASKAATATQLLPMNSHSMPLILEQANSVVKMERDYTLKKAAVEADIGMDDSGDEGTTRSIVEALKVASSSGLKVASSIVDYESEVDPNEPRATASFAAQLPLELAALMEEDNK